MKQTTEQIPLADDHCGILSIYLLKKSGKLFTTTTDGGKYMEVRQTKPRTKDGTYTMSVGKCDIICVCLRGYASLSKTSLHTQGLATIALGYVGVFLL